MLILSIDSAGSGCGVCVWQDGQVLSQSIEHMQRGQDARLMPMVVNAMEKAKKTFIDLDRIAVTRGPGSFTGLRVGLAAARGIGLAASKPVLGIDRFAIYHAEHAGKDVLTVIDSKRAEFFCKFFSANGAADEAVLMTQAQIGAFMKDHLSTVLVGDTVASNINVVATSASLASIADVGHANYLPRPLYLRAPDVTFPAAFKSR